MHGARPHPSVIVGFRWTPRQALARGLRLGAFLVPAAAAAGLIAVAAGAAPAPPAWAAVVGVPLLLGAGIGLARGRHIGTDVDDQGIQQVPAEPRSFVPWHRVVDVRAERRRRRTVVSIYLGSGACLLMRAPYDGPLLAHDPMFERKIFMLKNIWEMHRTWSPHR
jgi:hypothetical protein